MKCLKFPNKNCDLLTCHTKRKCLWDDPNKEQAAMIEKKFSEEEIKTAKKVRDALISGDMPDELKSIYVAGEIVMWDELAGRTVGSDEIEKLKDAFSESLNNLEEMTKRCDKGIERERELEAFVKEVSEFHLDGNPVKLIERAKNILKIIT